MKLLLKKIIYLLCILLGLVVMILTLLQAFHVIDNITNVTTILLNIEFILLCIGIWEHNKVISIAGVCVAIVLIIFTLI